MKRHGNLYEKICSMENLELAHLNARKDKTYYKEVKMVDSNPSYYLNQIREMLINGTYKVSEYTVSELHDKGKVRELMKLPYFPDRVIQWAIMLQIEDIFMKNFCHHTCASLKYRGIHQASKILTKYLKNREQSKYCLKLDVKKFYPNIDHEILKRLLRRKFKDEKLLNLIYRIIDSHPDGKGVPIGSYLSQFLANFYLSYFDHWLKEELKVKCVIRYMDDIVILHSDKQYLHDLFGKIKDYLSNNLKLELKDNHQVFPVESRGIDFVGYRHFYNYKLLRKTTCKRFKKQATTILMKYRRNELMTRREWCSINSYSGWLIWCNSHRLSVKYIAPLIPALEIYYRAKIKADEKSVGKYVKRILKRSGLNMKDFGIVEGHKDWAKEVIIGKDTVYVHKDIEPITHDRHGNEVTDMCRFHEIQYDKDEYFELLIKENKTLTNQLESVQNAVDALILGIE